MALFGRETGRDEQRAGAWAQWLNVQNPWAIGSLVLGVFSLIEFGVLLIFGVAGIAMGVLALRQIRRNTFPNRPNGARLAWGGIITSAISLVLAGLMYARVFG
jgi:hypothetical protein